MRARKSIEAIYRRCYQPLKVYIQGDKGFVCRTPAPLIDKHAAKVALPIYKVKMSVHQYGK